MRNEKVKINLIYNSTVLFLLRLAIVNLLFLLSIFDFYTGGFPQIPLIFISIFIMIEIFVKFEIARILPKSTISENPQDIYDAFTKEALESVLFKRNTRSFVSFLLQFPQSKFFLQKAVLDKKDLKSNVSRQQLNSKAFEIARGLNGKYVTTTDLLAAYLLLSETQTKLLFDHELKEEDIVNIAAWARVTFDEEYTKENKPRFVGIGFGETLVWGWTPETKKYTRDLTFSNLNRKMIEGREKEFETLISNLQKEQDNNVLIVGEIGTGKDNLFENLIFESYEAILPKKLNHRRFLEIMVGPLVAGAVNRPDLETRLQSIIEEVKHSGNVVLYIPEFQNLLGSSSYNIDLSGAILPYLKDGKMPIIATMTKGEYKRYFETNSLREVFEVITMEEPSPEIVLKMLFQKTGDIESQNKAKLSYKAVLAASRFADEYEADGSLPGSAVDLLNDTANFVRSMRGGNQIVTEDDVLERVEQKSHIPVGEPKQEEKNLLLNLEEEMHKSIIGQDEAVKSISEALQRIRAGITRQKPISFLFLGPTGVGKTQTAKTLANLYFKGEAHIIRLDMSEYGTPESLLRLLQSGPQSFLDQVFNHPFSLVLLDEFEKADQKILNLFLQVFDDGRMTDETGKTVSFTNTIIIATSNAGSEFIRESLNNNTLVDSRMLLEYLQRQAIFSPELLNRFDGIVTFKPLNQEQISEITKLMLSSLARDLTSMDITLTFDQKALEKISQGGFSEEFGARPLKRFIQDNLEDVIAKKLLTGEFKRGDKVFVDVDSESNLTFFKAS